MVHSGTKNKKPQGFAEGASPGATGAHNDVVGLLHRIKPVLLGLEEGSAHCAEGKWNRVYVTFDGITL